MARIFIEGTDVPFFGLPVSGHLYLVFENDNGELLVLRGGPTIGGAPYGPLILQGDINIAFSADSYELYDENRNPILDGDGNQIVETPEFRGRRELDLGDRNAQDVWDLLVQHAINIDRIQFPYDPRGFNSNGTIGELLALVGIDVNENLPTPQFTQFFSFSGRNEDFVFNYTINGTINDDVLIGRSGDQTINGGDGNDQLSGGADNDFLLGGFGNDTIFGDAGNDNIDGDFVGASFFTEVDTVDYSGLDLVNVNIGIFGDINVEKFVLVANPFSLFGGLSFLFAGLDTVVDIESIRGTAGNDGFNFVGDSIGLVIDGGAGFDTVDYRQLSGSITAVLDGNTTTVTRGGQQDTLTQIEGIDGTAQADTFIIQSFIPGVQYTINGSPVTSNQNAPSQNGSDLKDSGQLFMQGGNDTVTISQALLDAGAQTTYLSPDGQGIVWLEVNGVTQMITYSGVFSEPTQTQFFAGLTDGATVGLTETGNVMLDFSNSTQAIDSDVLNAIPLFNLVDEFVGSNLGDEIDLALTGLTDFVGGDAGDTVTGTDAVNMLSGGGGDDTLLGGAGNDILAGGDGDDVIDGGAGQDTVDYSGASEGVLVDLSGALDLGGAAAGDTLISIEGVIGTAFSDNFYASAARNIFDGGAGAGTAFTGDRVWYAQSDAAIKLDFDNPSNSEGDAFGDTFNNITLISGTIFDDEIIAGDAGGQWFSGDLGDDILTGGAGDDIFSGSFGEDTLNGGGGNDQLIGGRDDDILNGGAGDDLLQYGSNGGFINGGFDQFNGGTGIDTIDLRGAGDAVWIDLSRTDNAGLRTSDTFDIGTGPLRNIGRLLNIENAIGSAARDRIEGNDGDNVLMGNAADDVVLGRGGNDIVDGGTGDDRLFGGDDDDLLMGGAGDDELNGGRGEDTLLGGDGNDTLIAGAGDDVVNGGIGADTVRFNGRLSDYTLSAVAGAFIISDNRGTDGDDSLISVESLQFSDQTIAFSSVFNIVDGTDNDDSSLSGTSANDRILGRDGNDNLIDSAGGNDSLNGGNGNDILQGGAGADVLIGGNGTDQARYTLSDAGIIINLSTNFALGGHAQGDSLSTIENVTGSNFNDRITGDASDNVLRGLDGDDILRGSSGENELIGGEGDDLFIAGTGADFMNGGAGSDTIDYSGSLAGVEARLGGSQVFDGGFATGDSFSSIENLIGSDFDDALTGTNLANELTGNAGDDFLNGDRGTDILRGGDGNDTLIGGFGRDTLDGGDGIDTARYANANSRAVVDLSTGQGSAGHSFGDTLTNIENLFGSQFNDVFIGDAGDNELNGWNGVDRLTGGEGNDTLIGGAGNDRFIFTDSWGDDVITDFEDGGDLMDFRTVTGVDNIGDLTISANANGDAVVSFGGDSIVLLGIDSADITAADFLF